VAEIPLKKKTIRNASPDRLGRERVLGALVEGRARRATKTPLPRFIAPTDPDR